MDVVKIPGVDVVHDIQELPLPFKNEEFEEILCNDVFEHLTDYIPVLKDLYRILKGGGKLTVRVPHFTSRNNFVDPTHKKLFSSYTFDFFAANSLFSKAKERGYYFDFRFSSIKSIKITFERSSRLFFYNRLISWFVNRGRKMQFYYEATLLSRIFPAENIIVELIK